MGVQLSDIGICCPMTDPHLVRCRGQWLSVLLLIGCASPEQPDPYWRLGVRDMSLTPDFPSTTSDDFMGRDHLDLESIPLSGGETTHQVKGVGAFVQPAANLSLRRRGQFEAGLQFFQLVWDTFYLEFCQGLERNFWK